MNNRDFTIADFIKLALKRIWVIVAAMVIGGFIAFYYSNFMVTPLYQSHSKYLVDTTNLSAEDTSSANAQVEFQRVTVLSRLIVSSYIEILDTQNFAEHVAEKIKSDERLTMEYSAKALSGLVSYSFEEESETYEVTVSAYDPTDALVIAECIQNESGPYLESKKPTSSNTLEVIDNARYNPNPINMRTPLLVLVGMILGAATSFAVCFIIEINDVRVRDEKEVSEILGLPIIGSIPDYVSATDTGKKYGYSRS